MIGDRIRQARLAAGLTQDEVVQRLGSAGLKITKAALSKYEKGKSEPKQSDLVLLGRVLGVKPSYFLTEPVLQIGWLAFRKQTSLRKRKQEQIKAFVEDVVEKQTRLEDVFYPKQRSAFPKPSAASTAQDGGSTNLATIAGTKNRSKTRFHHSRGDWQSFEQVIKAETRHASYRWSSVSDTWRSAWIHESHFFVNSAGMRCKLTRNEQVR